MNSLFINSSITDVIKFTRTVNFDASSEASIVIAFLDQVWKVEIKGQRTRYWTFYVKVWLKSCSSDRKAVVISGWITDLDVVDTDDDWTDPATRPHFKVMRKFYEAEDNSVDPTFVSSNQVSSRSQLKLVFELFDENLRSSKLVEKNKIAEIFFASKLYYDVTIETMDGKIRAHKWILKLKSKYFEAMFDNELGDKIQTHFKIEDISLVVLNEVLRFIYTGRVEDIEALAQDILIWSDFFAIDDLRDMSADFVIKSLDPENVLSLMELAVNTNQDYLKEQTIAFFRKNMDQVVKSKSWLSTYKNLPSSVQEIIKVLVRRP